MGGPTQRSACGGAPDVVAVVGRAPRLRAASSCPPSAVVLPLPG